MKQKTKNFSLKDQLFNKDTVTYLGGLIFRVVPEFQKQAFIDDILTEFPDQELMERIHSIVDKMEAYLVEADISHEYPQILQQLLDSLPPELDPEKTDDDFGAFILAPYSFFVARHGCHLEYLDVSLDALEQMTKRFSCEWAIRTFLNIFPEQTYAKMMQWTQSQNYHVRRLASEGGRPRLPWGSNIAFSYDAFIPVLDQLYTDKTRFVTRSVANHLNDISKKDPEQVIATLKRWKHTGMSDDISYIISHSTRGLVKSGHIPTLKFLGYQTPLIEDLKLIIDHPNIHIGESLEFEVTFSSDTKQKLMIDYAIHFVGKNGKSSAKIFKGASYNGQGEQHICKKHPFKLMTTKPLYPGTHTLEIMINGHSMIQQDFELKTS